jgi:hypothetical protein
VQRTCPVCDTRFTAIRTQAIREIMNGDVLTCSRHCARTLGTGPKNGRWRGGRFFDGLYWYVRVATGQYRAEHRVVVEQALGRSLSREEDVHHVNHIKTDNRLENLRVMSRAEHTRLHASEIGWARLHASCIECGTTERPHKGRGRCTNCFARQKRR